MFKVGDLVTIISHDNDVVFKIEKIIDNNAYLKGVNVRLCADSNVSDLLLVTKNESSADERFYQEIDKLRKFERSDYFYISGKILHVDADISTSSVSK